MRPVDSGYRRPSEINYVYIYVSAGPRYALYSVTLLHFRNLVNEPVSIYLLQMKQIHEHRDFDWVCLWTKWSVHVHEALNFYCDLAVSKGPFIWSWYTKTLPASYDGRANVSLISFENSTNRLRKTHKEHELVRKPK